MKMYAVKLACASNTPKLTILTRYMVIFQGLLFGMKVGIKIVVILGKSLINDLHKFYFIVMFLNK